VAYHFGAGIQYLPQAQKHLSYGSVYYFNALEKHKTFVKRNGFVERKITELQQNKIIFSFRSDDGN
jgi:hypothetical protein